MQTEQKDQRRVDIEPMFVEAMKKGHGVAWELDLPFWSFWRKTNGKSLFKILLEKTFQRSKQTLHLAGRTGNSDALNGPIIAHFLTERYNTWFYFIIYSFNDLKKPDQIHHCARTMSLIILCQNASSYILRISFSGSKISTRLRNNETWYNEKK